MGPGDTLHRTVPVAIGRRRCVEPYSPVVTGLRLWTLNREHYPMGDVRFLDAQETPERGQDIKDG